MNEISLNPARFELPVLVQDISLLFFLFLGFFVFFVLSIIISAWTMK